MARFLAIDWDNIEVRFLLADVFKDRVNVLKYGSSPINDESISPAIKNTDSKNTDSTELTEEGNESVPISSDNDSGPSIINEGSETNQDFDEDEDGIEGENGTNEPVPVVQEVNQPDIGLILKKLLHKHRVGSASVLFAMSRSQVEIMHITLPKVPDSELPDLVKNQVLSDSTTYKEGQPLDYLPLGGTNSNSIQVMSVSSTRIQMKDIRTILSRASRRAKKMELRGASSIEYFLAGKITIPQNEETSTPIPVLLVQESCDEVSLILYDGTKVNYLRTFKPGENESSELFRQSGERQEDDSSEQQTDNTLIEERVDRFYSEIIRTISVGSTNLSGVQPQKVLLFGRLEESAWTEKLREKLSIHQLDLELINPFSIDGVFNREAIPEFPERYAPHLGMILAERPKNKPIIDLLHPHSKPEPPNYFLYLFILGLILAAGIWYAWDVNRKELTKQKAEIAELEKKRDQLSAQIKTAAPIYRILSLTSSWENRYGVIVLDELRDIMLRIPQVPDMTVTHLAYSGNLRGRPVFLIEGKIKSIQVYQQFYLGLTQDRSHTVVSTGPKPITDGGFSHTFQAQIFCARRPYLAYYQRLPDDLKNISNNMPSSVQIQTSQIPQVPAKQTEASANKPQHQQGTVQQQGTVRQQGTTHQQGAAQQQGAVRQQGTTQGQNKQGQQKVQRQQNPGTDGQNKNDGNRGSQGGQGGQNRRNRNK